MERDNYFVEGLQGAGKSTFVHKFSEQFPDCKIFVRGIIPRLNWPGAHIVRRKNTVGYWRIIRRLRER